MVKVYDEVANWNFGWAEVELRAVVQAIGNNMDKVCAYFTVSNRLCAEGFVALAVSQGFPQIRSRLR